MADKSSSEVLGDMIHGFLNTQMVCAAAKLGIADLLKDGPKSIEDISPTIAVNDQILFRIMRGLVVYGLLVQEEDGRFKLTEVGEYLRTDIPDSMHEQAMYMIETYQAWGALLHTIQTGEIAFNHVFNMGYFEYCEQNSEFGEQFNRVMVNLTRQMVEAAVAAYDFSSITKIVDVGGGYGTLIAAILKENPHMTGLLFDMVSVVEGAKQHLRDAGVAERCEIASGSFFDSIPEGGGGYILKSILHDWDDDSCIQIPRTAAERWRKRVSF